MILPKISVNNKFYFYSLFVLTLIIGFLSAYILPKRFFNDANTIILNPYNESGFIGSYPFTIFFYKITGLKYLPYSIVAIIQIPILFVCLKKIGVPEKFNIYTIKNIVIYIAILMIGIFIGMPSKEFITYIYIYIVLKYFLQTDNVKKAVLISSILIILFALFFRSYYFIVLIITYSLFFFSKIKIYNAKFTVFINGMIILLFLSILTGTITGENFSARSRGEVNSIRIGTEDTNSMIIPPIKTDTWYGEGVSIVYGFISVNVPVNGVKFIKSPQIILFVIWQIILFLLLYKKYKNNNDKIYYKSRIVFLFLFSYFVIQGIFEPDLGSAVRHKIGLLPLIYYCIYYDEFTRKISSRNL